MRGKAAQCHEILVQQAFEENKGIQSNREPLLLPTMCKNMKDERKKQQQEIKDERERVRKRNDIIRELTALMA